MCRVWIAPTRQALLEAVDREDLPRNVYYGDGGEIEPEALEEIRVAFSASSVHFDCSKTMSSCWTTC